MTDQSMQSAYLPAINQSSSSEVEFLKGCVVKLADIKHNKFSVQHEKKTKNRMEHLWLKLLKIFPFWFIHKLDVLLQKPFLKFLT